MTAEEVEAVFASDNPRVRVPIDFAHAIESVKLAELSQFVRIEDLLNVNAFEEGMLMGVSIYSTNNGEAIGGAWITLDNGRHIFASFDSMSLPE